MPLLMASDAIFNFMTLGAQNFQIYKFTNCADFQIFKFTNFQIETKYGNQTNQSM